MVKTYHGLSEEVFLQGTFAVDVVLEGDVAVGTECTGEDGDVAKYRLSGLDQSEVSEERGLGTRGEGRWAYRGLSRMLDILYSKF